VVREKALFLSRLFKLEFIYPVGKTFEVIFDETVEHLNTLGLVVRDDQTITIAPEAHARPQIEFIGDLLRDYLESYLIGARQAVDLTAAGQEKKEFVKRALENGRADYLAGVVTASEALSKTNLDNTVLFLVDQGYLVDQGKRVAPGTKAVSDLVNQIRAFLPDSR
jgi:glycerol-3-phosphate O-acyltransferase